MLAWLLRERKGNEPLWFTAKRKLIEITVESTRTITDASKILGCSKNCITTYRFREREREAVE